MSFPNVSSSVASMFSTVQPWAWSLCIAAAVTWSLVWLDSMSETNTWKRLTCPDRVKRINQFEQAHVVYFNYRDNKAETHLHVPGRLCRSISLLPSYLQVHHGRFSSHEWTLTASSSPEVPSALFSVEQHLDPSRIRPLFVSSCDCVKTAEDCLFLHMDTQGKGEGFRRENETHDPIQ